ncbi:hypothetical protein SAMN05216525_111138 [Bradyrhizobium sp. Gha]|nr:hypothetical protein SAMN05216525_111138 [Bradyrhizobium sp. Gha]
MQAHVLAPRATDAKKARARVDCSTCCISSWFDLTVRHSRGDEPLRGATSSALRAGRCTRPSFSKNEREANTKGKALYDLDGLADFSVNDSGERVLARPGP